MTTSFLDFWGKAQPETTESISWHPIAYHLLDVAAVMKGMLRMRPATRARAAWLLKMSEDDAVHLLTALAAIHDIGKFSPAFQGLTTPQNWQGPAALAGIDATILEKSKHTRDGWVLWDHVLRSDFAELVWSVDAERMRALECAVFYHHGWPTSEGVRNVVNHFGEQPTAIECARMCARAVLECATDGVRVEGSPPVRDLRAASWWVAGLLTLCDWLGSNQKRWFPYVKPDHADADLRQYWKYAQERARVAVSESGLEPCAAASLTSFDELTGQGAPRALQKWASHCELPEGPLLTLIEDTTGSGKTEAAQMLVHRLMATGRASGAYWAMPTQATANAMFERQHTMISRLFSADGARKPSLVLTHGQSWMHLKYRSTVVDVFQPLRLDAIARDVDESPWPLVADAELREATAVSAFLADDGRTALLADVGAGTVDQALLAVLPTRFNTLRLFALSEKVLVIDEVHAFDAYVSKEIERLLMFHARMGGNAIVLSATLPEKKRNEIQEMWHVAIRPNQLLSKRKLNSTSPATPAVNASEESPYPLATQVSQSGTRTFTPPRQELLPPRRVPVVFVHSFEDAVARVRSAAKLGAAVVWIRNTVKECIRAARALTDCGVKVSVFHARFAQGDRQSRESDVVKSFGKHSSASDRHGRVLIATQVVEQSLDLDFDVMLSDLAPVDLLIQRVGRRWRHNRDDRPAGITRELLVGAPHPDEVVTANWPSGLLPGTTAVYDNVGLLWRTWNMLAETPVLDTPGSLRSMIHRVYEDDDVPHVLSAKAVASEGTEHAQRSIALINLLKVAEGYTDGGSWSSDMRMPTRLGADQRAIRLARVHEGRLMPWLESELDSPGKCWSLSEVKVRLNIVPLTAVAESRWSVAVNEMRARWGKFEQEIPVLVLQPDGDVFAGNFVVDGKTRSFAYDSHIGLRESPG